MKIDGFLKALTVLIVIALIGFIATEVTKKKPQAVTENTSESASRLPKVLGGTDANSEAQEGSSTADGASESSASGRLVAGVMGDVPELSAVRAIEEVPWLESRLNAAFNSASDYVCQLLPPDSPVKAPVVRQPSGRRGTYGRIPILTVGLEVEVESRNKLPQASKSAIESYLRDHVLAIEPIIYQDERGSFYFGTECRAAFYASANPTVCLRAEPMIEQAVNKFRALGILDEQQTGRGRTLVMAFRYVQSAKEQTALTLKPRPVTELLFFHMKPTEPGELPALEVFATNDGRKDLYLLATSLNVIEEPLPTISASVRFEKFVLLGLYPADPIVTGIRQRTAGVLSMETIMKLTKLGEPEDRLTFTDVLDQFSTLTSGK